MPDHDARNDEPRVNAAAARPVTPFPLAGPTRGHDGGASTAASGPIVSLRWRRAAALLVGWSGVATIFYSPLMRVPAALAGSIYPSFLGGFGFGYTMASLGILEVVAAIGVRRGLTWGRIASISVTAVALVYDAWLALQSAAPGASPSGPVVELVGAVALPVAVAAFIVFAVTRRWRPAGEPAHDD